MIRLSIKDMTYSILPNKVRRAYDDLARDPKYQHFVRIPDRIIQCIDYFGIECKRDVAKASLQAYYLFIGVVDDAIDSGPIDSGGLVLNYLSTATPVFDEAAVGSELRLVTEILKTHLCDETYPLMIDRLGELYGEVVSESRATSIESYIAHRKSIGSLTAEASFVMIRPNLRGDHERLLRFMKRVGAIGCLVDSLIDLRADRRLGLLGFKPTIIDHAKLSRTIFDEGLRISLAHPGLCGTFLRAVVDNVRDRFRTAPGTAQIVSDRKSEAASVA
jgi:hypothetical protein